MYEARVDCSGSGCIESGSRQDGGEVAADRVVIGVYMVVCSRVGWLAAV